MHALRSSSYRDFKSDKWLGHYPESRDRKRDSDARMDCRLLPRIKASSAVPIQTLSNFKKENDRLTPCQNTSVVQKDRKFAARKHLMGSLSAPLNSSSGVKIALPGRAKTNTKGFKEYLTVTKAFDSPSGSQCLKIDQENLKTNHINRLDMNIRAHDPNRMPPSRMAATPLHHGSMNSQRIFYLTSDVARLSQVLGQNSGDNRSFVHDNEGTFSLEDHERLKELSGLIYRPLTPKLMKRLDKKKLSPHSQTEQWINKLPGSGISYAIDHASEAPVYLGIEADTFQTSDRSKLSDDPSWLYNNIT